jgi:RimJ/RimL family protein N-acetyltransferase
VSGLISANVVTLRPVVAEDCDVILRWRNEPATRAASFDTSVIAPVAHRRWLLASLRRADRRLYVVRADGTDCGVVRIDGAAGQGGVSIFLTAACHGRGIGPRALDAAAEIAARDLRLTSLLAEIKPENHPSIAAFRRARFVEGTGRGGVVTLVRTLRAEPR